jgi:small subunit ribosomal protein S16
MSTRIRLRKVGRKKVPLYRIVVSERTAARDGRFIEILGTYDPKQEGAKKVVVNAEKAKDWLAKGATASATVAALLKSAGVTPAKV